MTSNICDIFPIFRTLGLACDDVPFCMDIIMATRLEVVGGLHIQIPPGPFTVATPFETIQARGEQSVETARWCFDLAGRQAEDRCAELNAVAACTDGTVNDRVVGFHIHRTGNGPENFSICGP